MNKLRYRIAGLFLFLLLPLTAVVWMEQNGRTAIAQPITATPTPTLLPPTAALSLTTPFSPTAVPAITPSHTPPPSATPSPTATAIPSPTPTWTPTAVPAATATATATDTPTAVPVRNCPAAPAKPDYARYVAGPAWPTPNPDLAVDHFWLAKPLPGGGRFLTNLTYPYGYDGGGRYLLHNGADAAESLGTPILAAADGVVALAQMDVDELFGWRCDWYHQLVAIELDETWGGRPLFVFYGHVQNINVAVGQRVKRGEQVAEVGVGGAALVPHLHAEVRWGENEFGSTVNPYLWIWPGSTRGVIAGRLVTGDGRPWQGVGLSIVGVSEDTNELLNTWTYLSDPAGRATVNPDPGWAENFVFADLKPGEYVIYTKVRDVEYRVPITVTAGRVTPVEIVAEEKDEG